jgi:GT2 family glycosyltransferase
MNKKISIIIVNWNGEKYLRVCLSSLLFQTYANREIIFVDNGSTDGSVRYVKEQFPAVNVIELRENAGFTGGNTAGVKVANGEYFALVNNDTRIHERWLENLIQPMLADRNVGICASKILFESDGSFDSAGAGITTAAVGFNQGLIQGAEGFDSPNRVFGACGAAVLYRRRMVEEVGFLDEDFFLYDEDADLSFRAQHAGWKCVYVADAIVYHKANATAGRLSDTHVYYHTRNLEFVWVKNMPLALMLRFAHEKLLQEIGSFCYLCLRHGKWLPYLRAKRDALRMLPGMWQKRRVIQARRRVSNAYVRTLMTSMFTWDFVRQKIRQFITG